MTRITVVEHLDPTRLVPSGIDTIVSDFSRFSPQYNFLYVGITNDPNIPLGVWREIEVSGRLSDFLPVACFDREHKKSGFRIPHSLRFILGVWRFRRLINDGHFHTHRVETGYVVSCILSGTFTQYIHNDSNGLLSAQSDSVWRRFGFIYKWLERRVLVRAAGVAVFNRTDAPRLQAIKADVTVARTWFDPATFYPRPIQGDIVRRKISWVGRLDHQKDPWLVLAVARVIRSRGLNWKISMVGDGPLRDELRVAIVREGLEDFVELLGSLQRSAVGDLLRSSSMFLMTSHYEGSPTVLVEALACGVPAVCTNGADPDLVLEEGVSGLRVDERSGEALLDALHEVANYSSMGCSGAVEDRSAQKSIPNLIRVGLNSSPKSH